MIEQYRYDAFGGIFTGTSAPYNYTTYTGQSYDAKTGLLDMNARWYDATAGRFVTADTYQGELTNPLTQNRYAYVLNNPTNMWDPSGHFPEWIRDGQDHTEFEVHTSGGYQFNWKFLDYEEEALSDTTLVSSEQFFDYYLQTFQKTMSRTWWYE